MTDWGFNPTACDWPGAADPPVGRNAAGGVGGPDEDSNKENNCRNCGQSGHFSRECPEPRKPTGACFNCGEEGHNKADCTKPRVFKGTCNICAKEGHPAIECPDKPVDICKNCLTPGHKTLECTANRKFDMNDIPDKRPEEAWAILKKASDERDISDFREAIKVYSKAAPIATFVDIEKKLREENLGVYLIALEKEIGDCLSLIDLQGKLNCTYVVGFYFNEKPQRANLKDRWPSSAEENLERLADAGFPLDRQVPKCPNCGQMGHTARGCKEERPEVDRVEVKCVNCNQPGHRVRDCTEQRKDKSGCRNCGQPGHRASECTEPRSAEGVECKRCNEVGHFAKDCPTAPAPRTCRNCGEEGHISKECEKPRDLSTVTCRNCEEVGHFSRDCTKKKDWSKVQCSNCKEMGHTYKRCPKPADESNNGGFGGSNETSNANAGRSSPDPVGGEAAGGWSNAPVDTSGW
ncbi:hypothetical protein AJ80_03480 [Polytolypa hystricis UAMH7299]|uniref:CCHC-type domain-containing protein n=1 Tax=Polytolypa hystricis (strain UAMH7299) TaxID=1447883 RepID=A0A2B7YHQ3_POLH7|nr:hypothetical protein AJ80_03480 [Polytolypa hystricis UAMH7299]